MKPYLKVFSTDNNSVPEGDTQTISGEAVTISTLDLVVTTSAPLWGKANVGQLILADGQLRFIEAVRSSTEAILTTAFDADLTNASFKIVIPTTMTGFSVANYTGVSGYVSFPDQSQAELPSKAEFNLPVFYGAIAIDAQGTQIAVIYTTNE